MTAPLTATRLTRASEMLDGALAGVTRINLNDACRRLAFADRHEKALQDAVTPKLVALLLRRRGFRKVGVAGIGHDRSPLFEKVSA